MTPKQAGQWRHGTETSPTTGQKFHPETIYDAETGDAICTVYGIPLHCEFADVDQSYAKGMERAALIAVTPNLLAALVGLSNVVAETIAVFADVIGTEEEPGWVFDLREELLVPSAAIRKATRGEA